MVSSTGRLAGYPLTALKLGAHANSLINPRANGYLPQPDSADDQLSITRGSNYADKYKPFVEKFHYVRDVVNPYKKVLKPYLQSNYIVN